jgi:hypothetical protein
MRKLEESGSTGAVSVGSGSGVGVAGAVPVGIGAGGVSEARSGSREAHPALKNKAAETTSLKIRDMITNR